MTFALSERSLGKFAAVHPDMIKVVKSAIEYTDVDFGVGIGLRTEEEQAALFAKGASQTMKSKHLRQADGFCHAVDLFAYMNGTVDWSIALYDNIADAMKKAARHHNVHIRWGGAWSVDDLRVWDGTMEDAMNSYVDLRRSQGKRPFFDGPHFELR